jgi:adenosylcobinamide-GDP ribazoletransferase
MLRALACAILFLTRIPLPTLALDARDFARSVGYFAWVGGLIAALLVATTWASAGLGPRVSALVVVTVWTCITGALHLDGLADTVDGLSGGRGNRARTLEIMRDSRIGAHGAVALILVLGLKWGLLERALTIPGRPLWPMAPVAARFSCTLLMASFAYARPIGLGSAFAGGVPPKSVGLGAAAALSCAVLLGVWSLVPLLAAVIAALFVAVRMRALLGGLTGDTYGAAIELAEVAALLAASATALR